jgi:hypothetical protein
MMTSAALDMDSVGAAPTTTCHMVAIPHPGRSHINSMMNFCKILASKKPDILVTYVVTEEWLGFIGSDPKPENIRFASIPNVVPSELVRAADLSNFIEAAITKTEAPIERLLNRLEPLPTVIVADTLLLWAVGVGKRRNIPVAMYWPMSASVFTVVQHFHLFAQNGHFPVDISGEYKTKEINFAQMLVSIDTNFSPLVCMQQQKAMSEWTIFLEFLPHV